MVMRSAQSLPVFSPQTTQWSWKSPPAALWRPRVACLPRRACCDLPPARTQFRSASGEVIVVIPGRPSRRGRNSDLPRRGQSSVPSCLSASCSGSESGSEASCLPCPRNRNVQHSQSSCRRMQEMPSCLSASMPPATAVPICLRRVTIT